MAGGIWFCGWDFLNFYLIICDKIICTLILVVMLLLFGLDLLGLYDIICILYMVF